mgnify:CR=1 FL=1
MKILFLLLSLTLATVGSVATAQPAPQGCEVTVPTPFRLRATQALASSGQDFPARTHVHVIAYGTQPAQNGNRPVWARVDTAAGWLYVSTVLLRGCPQGSIAARPGDVTPNLAPVAPPPTIAPTPAPATLPPAPVPPPQPTRACVPGSTQTCHCVGGTTGVQACAASGMAYEPCACAAPTPPPAAAPIPPPAPSAPPAPRGPAPVSDEEFERMRSAVSNAVLDNNKAEVVRDLVRDGTRRVTCEQAATLIRTPT